MWLAFRLFFQNFSICISEKSPLFQKISICICEKSPLFQNLSICICEKMQCAPPKKCATLMCLYICCIFFQGSVNLFEYEPKTQVEPTEKKQRLVKQTSRTHQKDLELMVNYIVMFIFIVIYCIFTHSSAAVLASCVPSCTDSCNMAPAIAVSYGKTALSAATALEHTIKRVGPQIRVKIELCGK